MEPKVFCIGLSRTGTTSLCEALSAIGYKTLHFSLPLFIHPEIISAKLSFKPRQQLGFYRRWVRAREIRHVNTAFDDRLLENHNAFGDSPFPLFYRELDAKFPGSKFIYTYRDEEKWLKSMQWLYNEGTVLWTHGFLEDEIKLQTYGCRFYDRKVLLKSYREHHHMVQEYFKDRPQDLLSINIDQEKLGFDRLCTFLGKSQPTVGFPMSNASREVSFTSRVRYMLVRWFPDIKPFLYKLKKNRVRN